MAKPNPFSEDVGPGHFREAEGLSSIGVTDHVYQEEIAAAKAVIDRARYRLEYRRTVALETIAACAIQIARKGLDTCLRLA